MRLDLPRVLGAGTESAEEGMRRALEAIESLAPVALWVDEIEKGFAGSSPGARGDSRAARLLGAFSTWLQERTSSVFVVATANDVSALPPELLRRGRFDELFFVDLPDHQARHTILALHLQKRGRSVVLLDRRGPAEETSFGNAGLIQREGVYPYGFPHDFGALFRYALNNTIDAHYHLSALPGLVPFLAHYWWHSGFRQHQSIAHMYAPLIEHSISEHADLIRAEKRVNLAFSDGSTWLSVAGHGDVRQDRDRVEELWNPMVEAWFPEGKDSPPVALLFVESDSAEYWDTPGGRVASVFAFAKAKVKGERPDVGESGSVEL